MEIVTVIFYSGNVFNIISICLLIARNWTLSYLMREVLVFVAQMLAEEVLSKCELSKGERAILV